MRVERITSSEAKPWIMRKHYAHRMPCIIHAFGLFDGSRCHGVCTYSRGASPHLCRGVCGDEYSDLVYELNRLCVDHEDKNARSFLIAKTFKLMPKPAILISYADTSQGHVGYIYQATNWIYTGLSAIRKDAVKDGEEHLHSKGKWGEGFKYIERPRKHRYVMFLGSKTERKELKAALRYKAQPYPKGESRKYDASADIQTQETFLI